MSYILPRGRRNEDDYTYSGSQSNRYRDRDREAARRPGSYDEDEDDLLQQINSFRDKAEQLEELMKKNRGRERQDSRTGGGLSNAAAEEIIERIDHLREHVDERLDDALLSLKEAVADVRDLPEGEGSAEGFRGSLDEMKAAIEELKEASSEEAGVNWEELKAPMEEMKGQIEDLKAPMDEMKAAIEELKNKPAPEPKINMEELKAPVDEMKTEMAGMKTEILEKIHAEDVQVFRNTKNLLDEQAANDKSTEVMAKEFKSVKTYLKILSWFSIINFIVLVAYVLYALGVFKF